MPSDGYSPKSTTVWVYTSQLVGLKIGAEARFGKVPAAAHCSVGVIVHSLPFRLTVWWLLIEGLYCYFNVSTCKYRNVSTCREVVLSQVVVGRISLATVVN